MKFLQVKKALVALKDVPKKPSVFIDRLSWLVCGILCGFIITYLLVR